MSNTDTFGKVEEAFKQCEEFIENSTPEELQEYEESLGINPDDYKDYVTKLLDNPIPKEERWRLLE